MPAEGVDQEQQFRALCAQCREQLVWYPWTQVKCETTEQCGQLGTRFMREREFITTIDAEHLVITLTSSGL